ncbi:MAG: UvrD-helicase domain-containing protein, partial [Lachnospiraceae bacterium]|nr:UvrD-helicase domain-containing protein [Lachnospiraceae bacterium]
MSISYTPNQQSVITAPTANILVSAAAGSGKTSVLVERIMRMITDPVNPVDIDRILVVTFTIEAATQMKDRIRSALDARLSAEPDNERGGGHDDADPQAVFSQIFLQRSSTPSSFSMSPSLHRGRPMTLK